MSILSTASRTRREAPIRAVIHGSGGVGKSTFAAAAPSPIFITAEDGLSNIDAIALPEPKTWAQLLAQVDALRTEKHDYRTLVIDSLDWAEPLVWAHVCEVAKKKDIESFPYGKGYSAAFGEWRILLDRTKALRERGMHVIFIAHSLRRMVKNPEGEDYESWTIKLHEKSAAGLVREWADVIGFATHDIATFEAGENTGRHKALTTGERILRVQPHPAYDAKTRMPLPETVPLDWSAFIGAIESARGRALEVKKEIDEMVAKLDDVELLKKVADTVKSANGNATRLTEIANRLRIRITTQEGASV